MNNRGGEASPPSPLLVNVALNLVDVSNERNRQGNNCLCHLAQWDRTPVAACPGHARLRHDRHIRRMGCAAAAAALACHVMNS